MSQLELHILTSLAIFNRRSNKPLFNHPFHPMKPIFLRPLAGCSRSPPGSYWRLIRSPYGLCHAPKFGLKKLSSHLHAMGLQSSHTSPCLFVVELIEGEPPIYFRIYVDDIIYFSASDKVKRKFEESLSSICDVDFMGQVSYFLGIEFTWKHTDGHLSVCLTQQSFTETLFDSLGLQSSSVSSFTTPYLLGLVIDSIPHQEMDQKIMINYVCNINHWLVALIGLLKLPNLIYLLWYHFWLNIKTTLCKVIWMLPIMLSNT
jgi:hypothetical protein